MEQCLVRLLCMASSSGYCSSPCAACKFLRRKCLADCIFAPYFPPEEPQKFANVHKIFGASNVSKLLNEVLPHQREDTVNSLAYEAEARLKDPVYGCVGAISVLQRQVIKLQKELDATNADLIRYTCREIPSTVSRPVHHRRRNNNNSMVQVYGDGGFDPNCGGYYHPLAWGNGHVGDGQEGDEGGM